MSDRFVPNSLASQRFGRYPAYRDSGVRWLGEIPARWKSRPLKHLVVFKSGGTPDKNDVRYWLGDIPWVSPKDMRSRVITDTIDHITPEAVRSSSTRLVDQGAVLIVVRSGILRHEIPVAIAGREVALNQDLKALVSLGDISPRYLGYFIEGMKESLLVEWRKEGTTVESIETETMAATHIALPSRPEQQAIVRSLDRETASIDKLVAKQHELINLLQEKRTALISQTVTKGLDPDVAMKDSSVEWLGEIPAHWEVAALRYRYEQSLGKMLDTKKITGDHLVPYLRNVDVQWDNINSSDLPSMDIRAQEIERFTVRPGDLLVCEGGEAGRCAIWQGGLDPCGYQKALHRLRPLTRGRERPRFLYYTLVAAVARGAFADGQGSTIDHLTGDMLRAHRFPFPPTAEQHAIANFLDCETARIDAMIAKLNQAIERLNEYRSALIAAAVTGQIDVRHHGDHTVSDNTPPTQARP